MPSTPHLCILTTAHPADDVRVYEKFCCSFLAAGWRVTWVGPDYDQFGKRPATSHRLEFRLFEPPLRRISRLLAYRRARAMALPVRGVSAYYCPDPDAAAVAAGLARRAGARVIMDIHEVYDRPRAMQHWPIGPLLPWACRMVRAQMRRICGRCDLVAAVSESVLAPYRSHARSALIIRNCAPNRYAEGPPADVCPASREGLVLMHGKANLSRGTENVLKAVRLALAHRSDIRIVMFDTLEDSRRGSARADFDRIVFELAVRDAIDLRPPAPALEIPRILRTCDAGLIAYDRGLGEGSLPNRLFEYMAAGLPILAPVYSSEIARIVTAERCGILVDFSDPATVAKAIVYLREHPEQCRAMGARARKAFELRHNWEREIEPLLDQIQRWSGTPQPSRTRREPRASKEKDLACSREKSS